LGKLTPPIIELIFPRIVPMLPRVALSTTDWLDVNIPALMCVCTVFIKVFVAESVDTSMPVVVESNTRAACAVGIATDETRRITAREMPTDRKPIRDP